MKSTLIVALVACAHLASAFGHPLGLSKLGFGFDVSKGKTKAPVAQLTYSGAQWFNPYTGESSDVPDEIYIESDAYFNADVAVYSSYDEYASYHASASGVEWYYSDYAYTELDVAAQWNGLFTLAGASLVDVSASYYLYTAVLVPDCESTNFTARAESALPDVLDETTLAQYTKFIDNYGTHVVVEVTYGAEAHFFSFLNTTAMGCADASEALSLVSNSYEDGSYSDTFSGDFSFAGYFGGETVFYETFSFMGGLAEYISYGSGSDNSTSTSSAWLQSVKQVPAAVAYKLKPISEFMTTKKANMEKALVMYVEAKK